MTFTATIAVTAPGAGTPTGTVAFFDGETPIGSGTLTSPGVWTFSTVALSVGPHPQITADYSGGSNFNSSVSPDFSQAVGQASSTTTVTSSTNPSVFGQSVTFSATVAVVAPGAGTPTGTVTFYDGETPLGAGTLVSPGVWTISVATFAVGSHPDITADYSGDANFKISVSPDFSHTVGQASSLSTLTSSANPSVFEQSTTFTATVTAVSPGTGVPTGTVTFFDGTQVLGTGTLVSPGVWTFSTAALAVGVQSITFAYSGDPDFISSTSTMLAQSVLAPSTTGVTPSISVATVGQPVTLTATVTTPPDTGTPTGTVTFVDVNMASMAAITPDARIAAIASAITRNDGEVLGTASLDGGAEAMLTVSSLPAGLNEIYAFYSGDSTHSASSSLVADVQVNIVPAEVTSVARYGFHAQATYLVINFSTALGATAAGNPLNYRIVGHSGRRIAVTSAIYDPATHTVTLVPAERLNIHRRYRLTINGAVPTGLTNEQGVPIDGANNGTAGSSYTASITWRNLAGRASQLPTLDLVRAERSLAANAQTSLRRAEAKLHTAAVDHLLSTASVHVRESRRARH